MHLSVQVPPPPSSLSSDCFTSVYLFRLLRLSHTLLTASSSYPRPVSPYLTLLPVAFSVSHLPCCSLPVSLCDTSTLLLLPCLTLLYTYSLYLPSLHSCPISPSLTAPYCHHIPPLTDSHDDINVFVPTRHGIFVSPATGPVF